MTTNNGKSWRDLTWIYDEDKVNLLIAQSTVNSKEVSLEWMAKFDKENVMLKLTDVISEGKINFVKAGSQTITVAEREKDQKLDGIWYSSTFDPDSYAEVASAYSFQTDDTKLSGYGRFDISGKTVEIQAIYSDWYTENDKLHIIIPTGIAYKLTYKFNGEKLELYRNGELLKTLEKVNDGKIA